MEPEEQPKPSPVGAVTEPPKPKSEIPTIETYKTDIAEAIRRESLSAVKIAAASQKHVQEDSMYALPEDKGGGKKAVILILCVILILGGGGIIAYSVLQKPASIPVPLREGGDLVANLTFDATKTLLVPTDEIQFSKALAAERNGGETRLSAVTNVLLANGNEKNQVPLSTEKLFSYFGPRATPSLIRALGNSYAFGFHMLTQKEPFLIVAVNSYEYAYAGMLSWEPFMEEDLSPAFYTKEPLPPVVSTSTPVAKTGFIDEVIANKDVRVLLRNDGTPKLMYSFPDKKTLVITTNETTFKNIVNRLRNAELAR